MYSYDPFAVLPMPLPLMILEAVEDLSTLDYLLQVSPSAGAIFESRYSEIVEAVLKHSVGSLPTLLSTVFIRTNCLAVKQKLEQSKDSKQYYVENIVPEGSGERVLTRHTCSFEAVRSLVFSASHVQQLSQLFLDTCLARTNRLRPFCLSCEGIRQYLTAYFREPYDECTKLPEGQPYQPGLCEPASWLEEQRVYRALWRPELYFSLMRIVRDGEGTKSAACNHLFGNGPRSDWGRQSASQLDELDTVYDFLDEKQASRKHLENLPSHKMQPVIVPQHPAKQYDILHSWSESLEWRSRVTRLFRIGLEPKEELASCRI